MKMLNRRQFVAASAIGAAATACRAAVPPSPAGLPPVAAAVIPPAKDIAVRFVTKPKNEPVKNRLRVNFYGLIALVERRAASQAEVVCLAHGTHEAQLWYRKADMSLDSVPLSKVELSFEGIDTTEPLQFQDSDTEQPWQSLQWLLDPGTLIPQPERKKQGVTLNVEKTYKGHAQAAAYLPITSGVLSAGRPWSPLGGYISWVTKVFEDNDPGSGTSVEALGTADFSMTDNFNWTAQTTGTVRIRLSGQPTPIELPMVDGVTRVCITCDLAKPEPFSTALHHCLAYYDLLGISPSAQDLPFPTFKRGAYGEKDLADVKASSSDPECPTFRIQG